MSVLRISSRVCAACVLQTNSTTKRTSHHVLHRFPTSPACATHHRLLDFNRGRDGNIQPGTRVPGNAEKRFGSRGATIEGSREIEAPPRFPSINTSARLSENTVASRLAMVRITTPGTRVPG
jgi:hypothetical protein